MYSLWRTQKRAIEFASAQRIDLTARVDYISPCRPVDTVSALYTSIGEERATANRMHGVYVSELSLPPKL